MSKGIIQNRIEHLLNQAMRLAQERGQLKLRSLPVIALDAPKRPEWGDLASTVAMSLASSEQRAPHDIAQIIVDNMAQRDAILDRVDIVKPGFLNMTVKKSLWLEVLREIELQGAQYGASRTGLGQRVLIEFVSANPTGPLHVGHGRGAAVGQALANLLESAGYEVVREYYINDSGRQMKLLGASVYARFRQLQGASVPLPEDGYHGAYVEDVAAELKASQEGALTGLTIEEAERRCQGLAYDRMLGAIRGTWGGLASSSNPGSVKRRSYSLAPCCALFKNLRRVD